MAKNTTLKKDYVSFFKSLQFKIFGGVFIAAILPIVVVMLLGYLRSQQAIVNEVNNRLVSVRDLKQAQVEAYFQQHLTNVHSMAESPIIIQAMVGFEDVVMADMQKYNTDEVGLMQEYRKLYGGQPKLNDAGDGSAYSQMHVKYREVLLDYANDYGYYDIYLIDTHTGAIEFSLGKTDDYGTSLRDGPYAATNLGHVFQQLDTTTDPTISFVEDFAMYPPTGRPASVVGAPVFNGDTLAGMLVFQLSIESIDQIMQQREGMGETGESYLVGPDKLMRSDAPLAAQPTMFTQKVDNPTVDDALAGNSGKKIVTKYKGDEVLSAYVALNIGGVNWVVIAEARVYEVSAQIRSM